MNNKSRLNNTQLWSQASEHPIYGFTSNMTITNYKEDVLLLGGNNRNQLNLFQNWSNGKPNLNSLNIRNNLFDTYFKLDKHILKSISLIAHTFTYTEEGEFILYGGYIVEDNKKIHFLNQTYKYNIKQDKWKEMNSFYTSRINHFSTYFNNSIYSIGGNDYKNKPLTLSFITQYNTTSNKYTTLFCRGEIPTHNITYKIIRYKGNMLYLSNYNNTNLLYILNLDELKWSPIKVSWNFEINLDACFSIYNDILIHAFGSSSLISDKTHFVNLLDYNIINPFTNSNITTTITSQPHINPPSPWVMVIMLIVLSLFFLVLGYLIYTKVEVQLKDGIPNYHINPIWIDNTKSIIFDNGLLNLHYKAINRDSKITLISISSNHFLR